MASHADVEMGSSGSGDSAVLLVLVPPQVRVVNERLGAPVAGVGPLFALAAPRDPDGCGCCCPLVSNPGAD